MRHSDYWRKRFEQLEEAQLNKGLNYYNDLERQYKLASKSIEDQIAGWYSRFARNNEMSFAEGRQLLNSKELAEFKWSVQEYIRYGKENAVNKLWMKELENASAKVHITRLEALKLQIQQQCEILYGNQVDGLDKTMRNIYSEGYYHTAYEIQRGFNVGYDLHSLNEKQLSAVISKPWTPDGNNFINRCWTAKDQLVNTLHTELTQAVIRGDAPDKAIKTISKKFQTSKANAGRLVMTESAFFASAAQRNCFNDLGVERYEIVATLDTHTSPICRGLDGKVFEMKDFKVGITAPPFHCWCRTVTVPFFEDNSGGSRAARNEDGKTYYVPDTMKYPEWKKTFVDGGSKDGLQELADSGIKKVKEAFVPAKTIAEAQDYLSSNYNVAADYSKYNLNVANEINQEVGNINDVFGNVGALKTIGSFPKGYSTRWAGAYSPSQQSLWLRNVSSKNALDKLSEVAAQQFNIGHWSTPSPMHTIRHEIGHAVHTWFKESKTVENMTRLQKISQLRNSIVQEVLKSKRGTAAYSEYLSKYGMTNDNEFVAESIAEYMNGNPRETAKKVVETLINPVEGLIKRD